MTLVCPICNNTHFVCDKCKAMCPSSKIAVDVGSGHNYKAGDIVYGCLNHQCPDFLVVKVKSLKSGIGLCRAHKIAGTYPPQGVDSKGFKTN